MADGLYLDFKMTGLEGLEHDWKAVSRRMAHPEPAFKEVLKDLEEGEKRLFARYKGKYVDTGALMASLTQDSAEGAIREAHYDELVFGTSIIYAQYQRKGKKSAVLVLQPKTRREASKKVLDYVVYGEAGALA